MGNETNPHTVELEAHRVDISKLKDFLQEIELSGDLIRFSIEIEAEKPIFKPPTETGETPEKEPEQEQEEIEVESPEENGAKDHPADKLNFEKHGEGQTKVLSHTDDDLEGITKFNTGTNRWKICSFLYRQNEPLTLSHIDAFLKDTPYEVKYKSISSAISYMRDEGIMENANKGKGDNKYQLTELGEKKVAKTQENSDDYILTMADKVAGLHPTDSFDLPDLEV